MQAESENKLEAILRLAATEPAHRPEFYEILLDANVFILGTSAAAPEDERVTLEAGSSLQIQHWEKEDGSQAIPFFSSLAVLNQSIESEESYVELPARALLEMTLGATLFLNPRSDHVKEFLPEEVQHVLSLGVGSAPEERVIEQQTKVLLGQPAQYPSNMIDSLTQLFAKHASVSRAYVAMMHDPAVDEKAHLIVGIDATGDIEKIMREAGSVAADTAPAGETVDLFQVDPAEGGLSDYFIKESKPFYEKSWGGKLKSALGIGRA